MFCLKYYRFQKYLDDVEELKIIYKPADNSLKDFLEKYKDKSIVIDVTNSFNEIDAKLLSGLSKKFNNIKIIFNYNDKEFLKRAKSYEIPYFFTNPITSIDELTGVLKLQPTDMYICEELGFFLDKISKILHENNIKVRVYPNICQSSFSSTPSIKTFFIRPDDIYIYSPYVDVFELISDEERQQIVYKVYKQEKWFGKIKEIIPSFKGELDSKYILPYFGVIRAKCGKRCLYKPGSCDICNRFIELADTFKENKIVIQKAKKKN